MNIDDKEKVKHMLDAAQQVKEFVKEKCRDDLDKEPMLLHALVRLLEIIGEAANRISPEVQHRYTEISWIDIISMRNRLIHGYFNVNLDIVWKTAIQDIPVLVEQLNKLKNNEE